MNQILSGTFTWEDPKTMVNAWVKQLQYAYDEEELRKEASEIGSEIKPEIFVNFFKKKPE